MSLVHVQNDYEDREETTEKESFLQRHGTIVVKSTTSIIRVVGISWDRKNVKKSNTSTTQVVENSTLCCCLLPVS